MPKNKVECTHRQNDGAIRLLIGMLARKPFAVEKAKEAGATTR